MPESQHPQRQVLPIPDAVHVGVTTYDAKDPATAFPPIEPLRPPEGAPNVLVILIDDAGFGFVVGVRWSVSDAELRTPGGERAQVQPLPHDSPLLADPAGPADRPEPSCRRHGRHHRDRHLCSWVQLDPAEVRGAPRRDAQAERLFDGAVRQVPRGAGLGDEPDGAVRRLAHGRWRLRALLRLSRRRDEPVRAGALRGHGAIRARPDTGRGLPLHGGHDGSRDRLDPPAEGADAGQAVLRLLRAWGDARAAPRPRGVVREVQGQVRPGLGQGPRGDDRAPEGARRDPRGRGAHRASR